MDNKVLKMLLIYIVSLIISVKCSDITNLIFKGYTNGMPAAFGDFNSDELTDVFVLLNNSKTVEILLAHEEEPILRPAKDRLQCSFKNIISNIVPGDFDGDAFMDVLVTTVPKTTAVDTNSEQTSPLYHVFVLWGGGNYLNCSNEEKPIIKMRGQPLTIDYNQDMIIDLFGQDINGTRKFWIFKESKDGVRVPPEEKIMHTEHSDRNTIKIPHSNAFLDLNDDSMADLFLTTDRHFEVWNGKESEITKFVFNKIIPHPEDGDEVGQSLFIDVELKGSMDLVTPICTEKPCKNSKLMVYSGEKWHDLLVNFKDDNGITWRFFKDNNFKYTNVITLHSGDFNLDGYPDILATLAPVGEDKPQSFLLENVACVQNCGSKFTRSYAIKWNALHPFQNGSTLATFFDFYQDGVLDVMLVTYNLVNSKTEYRVAAFKNSLDYDANFIKVMVLTGLTNEKNPMVNGRVGKKRRTYGTNLPGPSISYKTITQEGFLRHGVAAQLPQSAHYSLNLPYTIFGLGRTPNFVDSLTVGLSNHSRAWTQIIPNSQMVVIPWPTNDTSKWKAQLFVTPSKLILMSVGALTAICGLITVIIAVLYWKERQEDKKERLSESHRFHFDAM